MQTFLQNCTVYLLLTTHKTCTNRKYRTCFLSQPLLGHEAERQFHNTEDRIRRHLQNVHKTFDLSTLSYITSPEETSRLCHYRSAVGWSRRFSLKLMLTGGEPRKCPRVKLQASFLLPRSKDIRSAQRFSLCSVYRANIFLPQSIV